jgi:hypothetical protein
VRRLNVVIAAVASTLTDLRLAIAGTIALSDELAEALDALFAARVPAKWARISWEVRRPLLQRILQLVGLVVQLLATTPCRSVPCCCYSPAEWSQQPKTVLHKRLGNLTMHCCAWAQASGSGAWFAGLLARHDQLHRWLTGGRPKSFWMPGFFNPQGFLTAGEPTLRRAEASGC